MDNLMHIRFQGADHIVIIEAKKQLIEVQGNKWLVRYGDVEKDARVQVESHIATIREYLRPIARGVTLKYVAIVVSPDVHTPSEVATGALNSKLYLTSTRDLKKVFRDEFNITEKADRDLPERLRIAQSSFLDMLRLSIPLRELGHPELPGAIFYVERCRRALDNALFQHFSPAADRWVINGSAGMGKSVLLAYAATVLSCDAELWYDSQGDANLKPAEDRLKK